MKEKTPTSARPGKAEARVEVEEASRGKGEQLRSHGCGVDSVGGADGIKGEESEGLTVLSGPTRWANTGHTEVPEGEQRAGWEVHSEING